MKLIPYFASFLFLLSSGCGFDDDTVNPAEEVLDFYTNAQVSSQYPFAASGDKVVFHRNYVRPDNANIADDEYSDDLFFEVSNPGDSFEFSGEELTTLKPIFLYYCYCAYTEKAALIGGSISGTKKSATEYEVDVDLTFEYYYVNAAGDTLSTDTRNINYSGLHAYSLLPQPGN